MSRRRKPSPKELGAILSQAVPPTEAEAIEQPTGTPEASAEEVLSDGAGAVSPEKEELAAESAVVTVDEPTEPLVATTNGANEEEQRPSIETSAEETPAEADTEEIEPVLWRKSTIPFREDQYQEIGHLLSEFHFRHNLRLTIAEVVRLGLDKMLDALKNEEQRYQALTELYEQQRRESLGNEKLKHSKSRGLSEYLMAHGAFSRYQSPNKTT